MNSRRDGSATILSSVSSAFQWTVAIKSKRSRGYTFIFACAVNISNVIEREIEILWMAFCHHNQTTVVIFARILYEILMWYSIPSHSTCVFIQCIKCKDKNFIRLEFSTWCIAPKHVEIPLLTGILARNDLKRNTTNKQHADF